MESGGGFFTTIQNIMAVAADKAYLNDSVLVLLEDLGSCLAYSVDASDTERSAYQVKIYCVWLFLRFTSAGRPIGIPAASLSYAFRRSGACNIVSYLNYKPPYNAYPWSLRPRLRRFQ